MRRTTCLIFAAFLALAGCATAPEKHASPLDRPMVQLSRYGFDPSKPLPERIGPPPAFLLKVMADADGAPDYGPYTPTPEQKAVLLEHIRSLPAGMRKAFEERLVGLYFIKNFMGNGITTWVTGKEGPLYAAMILNPAVFSRSLSETLTLRERSLFKDGEGVRFECGKDRLGLLYALLHEGTHVYDYVRGITPYVEPDLAEAFPERYDKGAGWDVWNAPYAPSKGNDFPYRKRLGFYGLDGAPVIAGSEAAKLYSQLRSSPFVSLYGSRSWAEDAAELVVFHHVTQVLGETCAVEWNGPRGAGRLEPMASERIRARALKVYSALR